MIGKLKDWLSVRNAQLEEYELRHTVETEAGEEWQRDSTVEGWLRHYDEEGKLNEEALKGHFAETGLVPVYDKPDLDHKDRQIEYVTLVPGEVVKVRNYWNKVLLVPKWSDE